LPVGKIRANRIGPNARQAINDFQKSCKFLKNEEDKNYTDQKLN
jgi:hypothetical protein